MGIIDAHVHTQFLPAEREFAAGCGIDCSEDGFREELAGNGVEAFVSIGSDLAEGTPIGLAWLREQRKRLPGLVPVVGINPYACGPVELEALEDAVQAGDVRGVKIYAGYYPLPPTFDAYRGVYRLAERYRLPVIIHTGDTIDKDALVKYANPIEVDELAVRHRGIPFIIAHLGNPWTREAAEVVYKNENVHADLSAFVIGDLRQARDRRRAVEDVRRALDYAGTAERFLYGSDWPLARIRDAIEFVKDAVPRRDRDRVFHGNAARLFNIVT
jgi:hypothetical protein